MYQIVARYTEGFPSTERLLGVATSELDARQMARGVWAAHLRYPNKYHEYLYDVAVIDGDGLQTWSVKLS